MPSVHTAPRCGINKDVKSYRPVSFGGSAPTLMNIYLFVKYDFRREVINKRGISGESTEAFLTSVT